MGKRVDLASLATEDLGDHSDTAPAAAAEEERPETFSRLVPVGELALNPLNKRPPGGDDELEAVADTIRANGVIQPLVVCSVKSYLANYPDQEPGVSDAKWVTLIGNRRLQAARIAAVAEVPILVNDEQAESMYEVMLVENGQRRDLPPLLEAEAMKAVLDTQNISRRELSRRIGKTHVYISQRLALLRLVPELKNALQRGELKIEFARELGELDQQEQEQVVTAGAPYRKPGGNGVTSGGSRSARQTIHAATPAIAAESIRKRFTADELAELIQLLTSSDSHSANDDEPGTSNAALHPQEALTAVG